MAGQLMSPLDYPNKALGTAQSGVNQLVTDVGGTIQEGIGVPIHVVRNVVRGAGNFLKGLAPW